MRGEVPGEPGVWRVVGPRLSDLFLSSQSDERLVTLARAGHERAFAVIVERYRPELQRFARRYDSDGRAEDIVQQGFLSAFAALRSGAHVGHLRGWLHQIVRHEAIRARPVPDLPLDDAAACGEPLEDLVQRRALARAALSELSELPTRQREALVATALRGSSRADIARTMGLSEGAVRQLVHRARVTVRTAITAVTPYPLAQMFAGWGSGAAATSDASLAASAAAGGASAGGLAVKLGALIASGVVATGAATIGVSTGSQHRDEHSGRVTEHPRGGHRDDASVRPARATPVVDARRPRLIDVRLDRTGGRDSGSDSDGSGRRSGRSSGGPATSDGGRGDGSAGSGDIGGVRSGGGPGPSGPSQATEPSHDGGGPSGTTDGGGSATSGSSPGGPPSSGSTSSGSTSSGSTSSGSDGSSGTSSGSDGSRATSVPGSDGSGSTSSGSDDGPGPSPPQTVTSDGGGSPTSGPS